MPVFVIDKNGVPLLPTNGARGRLLLKHGKATVYSVVPFTIQLKYKEDRIQQFLSELTELTRKTNIEVWGCGCCGSPGLEDLCENQY